MKGPGSAPAGAEGTVSLSAPVRAAHGVRKEQIMMRMKAAARVRNKAGSRVLLTSPIVK